MNQMQEIQESRDPKILPDVLDVLDDPPGGDRAEGGVRVRLEDLAPLDEDVVVCLFTVVVLVADGIRRRSTTERRHSRQRPHPSSCWGHLGFT